MKPDHKYFLPIRKKFGYSQEEFANILPGKKGKPMSKSNFGRKEKGKPPTTLDEFNLILEKVKSDHPEFNPEVELTEEFIEKNLKLPQKRKNLRDIINEQKKEIAFLKEKLDKFEKKLLPRKNRNWTDERSGIEDRRKTGEKN